MQTRRICHKSREQISRAAFVILSWISRNDSLQVYFFKSHKTVNNLSRTFRSTSHMKNLFRFERWTYFTFILFLSLRHSQFAEKKYFRELVNLFLFISASGAHFIHLRERKIIFIVRSARKVLSGYCWCDFQVDSFISFSVYEMKNENCWHFKEESGFISAVSF